MKRPVGLILSAISLGCAALWQLLFAILMGFSAYLMKAHPPAYPIQPSGFYTLLSVVLIVLICVVWTISTLVGLLFFRPWARHSILAMGVLTIFCGAVSLIGSIVFAIFLPRFLPASPHPEASRHILQIFALGMGLFYAVVTAIGIAWIVYFTRPTTRQLFIPRDRFDADTGLLLPPLPSSRRPLAITVLAILTLIGAVFCLALAFRAAPAFFFGILFTGIGGQLLYTCFGLVNLVIGVFLLRLNPAAHLAMIASLCLGCLNTLLSLLPWYQRQFQEYMQIQFLRHPLPPNIAASPLQHGITQIMMYLGGFNLIVYGILFWLLHHYRAAFSPAPPVPAIVEPL